MTPTPMMKLATATHCGCVRCQNQIGLRRRNSIPKRSTADSTRNQPKTYHGGWSFLAMRHSTQKTRVMMTIS